MSKIDILLATYNGAEYIAAQVRSLQNQTFDDWCLLVHDDGSTDATLEILDGFAQTDSRIRIINDGKRFHNCALNFMHLLGFSEAPFCIFCDQDDIWLENKLQVMYDAIASKDNTKPHAVYSNSFVYNPDVPTIGGSASLCLPTQLKDILFMNAGIQGCALMFNAALRNICSNVPKVVAMHDHVLTLAAAVFGSLTYVDRHLMLYRRHEMAVTGPTAKRLTDRIAPFFDSTKTVLEKKHYAAIYSFVETYDSLISDKDKAIFSDFFRFEREGRIRRALHVFVKGYKLYGRSSILAFKMLVRNFV